MERHAGITNLPRNKHVDSSIIFSTVNQSFFFREHIATIRASYANAKILLLATFGNVNGQNRMKMYLQTMNIKSIMSKHSCPVSKGSKILRGMVIKYASQGLLS